MRLWLFRIAPERFIHNLSGHGGSYRDGARWSDLGYPVLYFGTSASVTLAKDDKLAK
ncbi:RES domain-containing protein [Vreelandella rituensis]|uniref:RES domain-containing protein n=1 Tax=Vreelandella rituensis TaxID=2282306 RepID=A0A368U850_9GAMM|nr:RES domain-containing protein [Halomonas rituensis]